MRGNALIERHLCRRHAGAVPVAHHQRLHREGAGLQRGRRPLQHHLHPGRGHRHRDRQPRRAADPRLRRAASSMDELARPRWTRTSRAARRCASGSATASPKWGNDDEAADEVMRRAFEAFVDAIDGRPNGRGGTYGVDMLPTTCHVYFGAVTGATPDGRRAATPLSEGISPVQGADRLGPTAVLRSAAKMDQARTSGTLLNMKFNPGLIAGEEGIAKLSRPGPHLLRAGRPPHPVQRRQHRHPARGAGEPGRAPRPDRPRRGLQRLLLRPLPRAPGRDHRPHRARGDLAAAPPRWRRDQRTIGRPLRAQAPVPPRTETVPSNPRRAGSWSPRGSGCRTRRSPHTACRA